MLFMRDGRSYGKFAREGREHSNDEREGVFRGREAEKMSAYEPTEDYIGRCTTDK